MKKTAASEEGQDNSKKKGLHSTWGLHGTGCPMCSNLFIMISEKRQADLYELERLDPGYQVVFGENECHLQ